MLHGTKVIILVEKKGEKKLAWLGFELTTFILEVNHCQPLHHGSFIIKCFFLKFYKLWMITFVPCNVFERICEFILCISFTEFLRIILSLFRLSLVYQNKPYNYKPNLSGLANFLSKQVLPSPVMIWNNNLAEGIE